MANTFDKIQKKFSASGLKAQSEKSREWFIRNLKNLRNMSRVNVLNDENLFARTKPPIGRMMMFFYDPKGKETLPHYDRFPLVIMVEPTKDGFYGLNLHYLPLRLRAVFFDELMDRMNNTKYDDTTRFRLTYDLMRASRKLRLFQPCFKRYLTTQIVSKIVYVPPSEWEIAMFMPTDDFVGEDRQSIWRKTRTFAR